MAGSQIQPNIKTTIKAHGGEGIQHYSNIRSKTFKCQEHSNLLEKYKLMNDAMDYIWVGGFFIRR